MKDLIYINNIYHKFDEDRLKYEIECLKWYSKKHNRVINSVIVASTPKDKILLEKEILKLGNGDRILTLEISDISKDDSKTLDFISNISNKGVFFRAFYEFLNTENEYEKALLIKCLDLYINYNNEIPF